MTTPYPALMPVTPRPEPLFVAGEGDWLVDSVGQRYLDFVQGWAVNSLGHAHPLIQQVLAEQVGRLCNVGPAYYTEPLVRYAERLTKLTGMDELFPASTGAEANEGAIKLARKWGALHKGGAYRIVTLHNGFHGRTLATMSASGKAGWDTLFAPKVPGFDKVPINDLAALEAAVTPETVAVMLELVQGEGGVIPATPAYVAGVVELTRRHGLLLIVDEIQTGMGRTGTLLACEHYGVEPDILTLGKGIGGGVPLAALLARREVSCFAPGDQGGTYTGNALMAAVGDAVLSEIARPAFLAQVEERGALLETRLRQLGLAYGLGEVRGRGLLLALDVGALDASRLAARALERGLLLNAPRPSLLRFMPALNVAVESIERMTAILGEVLAEAVGGQR